MKRPLVSDVAAWACLVGIVSGSPTINFPINAQVPPVARLSQTFSFVFAENTFISTASDAAITYTLDSAPIWLSLESSERWLHGTPGDSDISSGDVVGVPFALVATDSTGSTSLNVTLVVSRNSAPTVEIPVSTQLADSGLVYSEPSSILSYPDSSFNFTFSQSTFSDMDLNYYAVSSDNSPLPSWVNFDSGKLMFSGTTPSADSLIEPPETFNFQLVASDVTGFAAASVSFSIIVGSREVTADHPSVVLNATAGTELVYNGLQSGIKIDGQVAGPSNLTAKVISSPPSWLTFDTDTWALSGTPPSTAHNAAFAINFHDALLDSVNVTFQVDFDENGTVFHNTLPSMQAQRGSVFSLNLSSYLVTTDGVEATVETEPTQDWLVFNSTTLTLSGDVPTSQGDSPVSVSIKATRHNASESETFLLEITGSSATTSSAASASSSTEASTSSSILTAPTSTSSRSTLSKKQILMAVLIPTMLLAGVVLVVACCMCCRRRRTLKKNASHGDISYPVPFDFVYKGEDDTVASAHNVSNVSSAYAEKQAAMLEQANIGVAVTNVPIGTAITCPSSDENNYYKVARGQTGTMAVFATYEDGQSETLSFPAPPSDHERPGQCFSSASSGTGTGHSARDLAAAAAAGQWPFEESTLRSASGQSQRPSLGDGVASLGSHEDEPRRMDPLGIYGNAVSASARHDQNSESVPRRQTVRYSTPMQIATARSPDVDGRVSAGLHAEHLVASQEAVVLDGQSVAGTVPNRDETGTRSTMPDQHGDLEAGVKTDGADAKPGFLFDFASRIANRFIRGSPTTEDAPQIPSVPTANSLTQGWPAFGHRRFSSSAGNGHPSPDAPSFDTDVGSVTIGNITTAKPYKPRPVFIGNVTRITEESPQPKSPMWGRNGRATSSGSSAVGARQQSQTLPAHSSPLKQQERFSRRRSNGDDDDDDDGYEDIDVGSEAETSDDAGSDVAVRVDAPRPAFLRQSRLERDATTDLSQDIASSLRSRRPASSGSGLSGISAAMEEVLSMLLLPDSASGSETAATPNVSTQQAHDDSASELGGYARSSNSWETVPSSERNWASHYGGGSVDVVRSSSDAAHSPVQGSSFARADSTVLPASKVCILAQAPQAQQSTRFLQIRTVTASSRASGASAVSTREQGSGLSHGERQFRHTSSYYGDENRHHHTAVLGVSSAKADAKAEAEAEAEAAPTSTSNEYEYPTPFVASGGGSGAEYNNQATSTAGAAPWTWLAIASGSSSNNAHPHAHAPYQTQASPGSAASSGSRAFI